MDEDLRYLLRRVSGIAEPSISDLVKLVNLSQKTQISQQDLDQIELAIRKIHRPVWEEGRQYYSLTTKYDRYNWVFSDAARLWRFRYDEINEILENFLKYGQEEWNPDQESIAGRRVKNPRWVLYRVHEVYLQLHDHHTIHRLRLPDGVPFDEEEYALAVQFAIVEFEERTKVKIFQAGRSGRHICVEDWIENRLAYPYLCEIAVDLENKLIHSFNQSPSDSRD